MTEVVVVRVSSASGSSTSSVRLPSAASTTMAPRSTYLTRRRAGGMRPASRRAERKRSQPSSVPRGQIQPHQTRPSTRVSPSVTKASANGAQPGAGGEHGGQRRQRVEAEEDVRQGLRLEPLQPREEQVDEEDEGDDLHGAPCPAGGSPAARPPARRTGFTLLSRHVTPRRRRR